MDFGNLLGYFDLTARCFGSLGASTVVGRRERHQQPHYRLAVTPRIALWIVSEDSAEEHTVQSQP